MELSFWHQYLRFIWQKSRTLREGMLMPLFQGSALLSNALQMDNYQCFNVMNQHYLGGCERR